MLQHFDNGAQKTKAKHTQPVYNASKRKLLFIALIACRPRFGCERIHTDRTYEWPYRPLVYRTLTHTFSPFQSIDSLVGLIPVK